LEIRFHKHQVSFLFVKTHKCKRGIRNLQKVQQKSALLLLSWFKIWAKNRYYCHRLDRVTRVPRVRKV